MGFDHIFSPTLLNHLNVGLNRIYNNNLANSADGTDWPVALGISGAHGPIFPQISFGASANQSLTSLGNAQFDANFVNSLVVADSVSWTRGRHQLRFGIDWRTFQYSIIDRSHESPSIGFDLRSDRGRVYAQPAKTKPATRLRAFWSERCRTLGWRFVHINRVLIRAM